MAAPLARLRLGVLGAAGAAVAVGAAYVVGAQLAFDAGWVLEVAPPLVALVTGIGAMIAVSQLKERFERLRVANDNELLEQLVRERTAELRETQLEVIHRLAQAFKCRHIPSTWDSYTVAAMRPIATSRPGPAEQRSVPFTH